MNTPRCGIEDNMAVVDVEDDESDTIAAARQKRYIIQNSVVMGQKWKTRDLKYRVTQYTQKLDSSVVDGVFRKAFYVSRPINQVVNR